MRLLILMSTHNIEFTVQFLIFCTFKLCYPFLSGALSNEQFSVTVADACGEKLAWFFGITSPKYQAAIDEFYRLKHEVRLFFTYFNIFVCCT